MVGIHWDGTLCAGLYFHFAPSQKPGQAGKALCSRRERVGHSHGKVSSTSAPVPTVSVDPGQDLASCANYVHTFLASSKFRPGETRKALMATCVPSHSPRQRSVNPPDATAMLPHFLSPVENTVEVGRHPVAPHTFGASGRDVMWLLHPRCSDDREGGDIPLQSVLSPIITSEDPQVGEPTAC